MLQKIKLFASRENLSEMLSHSDIELADIGRKKTALFIVVQDEKKTKNEGGNENRIRR